MQTTSSQFDTLSTAPVRPISYAMRVAWERTFDDTKKFFVLDESLLDGGDMLAPSDDNPVQEWDYYTYTNMTDRLVSYETSRSIKFPYSVSSAIASFRLENTDDMMTPGSGAYLADYMLPSRPIRMFAGFNGENLPQFVGLTDGMPTIEHKNKEVSFNATDFLSRIMKLKTPAVIAMQNVRTDEVLDYLFQAAGLTPSQYSLAKGRNEIKFVYFDKDTDIGDIILDLMQAEMGNLFMDESGIIRFVPRIQANQSAAYTLDDSNIVDISVTDSNGIINVVDITASIREVQVKQPLWTLSDSYSDDWVVPASSSKTMWANLDDPALTTTTPTVGTAVSDSYIMATDLTGASVGAVTITSDYLFTNSYQFTVANANAYPIRVSEAEIWGEPAKIVDVINYEKRDTDSVDKYEEQKLSIENNYLQSVGACDSLALTILDSYSEYAGDIEITIKGTPSLQLNDVLEVTKDTFTGDYKVKSITNTIIAGQFRQKILATKYTPHSWFTLEESLLDGTDVLTP